jgi:hypothetical protein
MHAWPNAVFISVTDESADCEVYVRLHVSNTNHWGKHYYYPFVGGVMRIEEGLIEPRGLPHRRHGDMRRVEA